MCVFKLIDYNRHLLYEDKRGLILVDTGSPMSFHKDGLISIDGVDYNVPTSLMHINTEFIRKNVGIEVSGLIGMDIIDRIPTTINLGWFGEMIVFGDIFLGAEKLDTFNVMGGLKGVRMRVAGRDAKLLLDTGAQLAYIDEKYTYGVPHSDEKADFSPLTGQRYFLKTYTLQCECGERARRKKTFEVQFANPPEDLLLTLRLCGADGIIGYDFFSNFRVAIQDGYVALPPQGI